MKGNHSASREMQLEKQIGGVAEPEGKRGRPVRQEKQAPPGWAGRAHLVPWGHGRHREGGRRRGAWTPGDPRWGFPRNSAIVKNRAYSCQAIRLWDGGLSQRLSTKISSTIAAVGRGRAERSLCVRAGCLREPGSFP